MEKQMSVDEFPFNVLLQPKNQIKLQPFQKFILKTMLLSNDLQFLANTYFDKDILHVWNLSQQKIVAELKSVNWPKLPMLYFTQDSKFLYFAFSYEYYLFIIDLKSPTYISNSIYLEHIPMNLIISNNELYLCSMSFNKPVTKVWVKANNNYKRQFIVNFKYTESKVFQGLFINDDKQLIFAFFSDQNLTAYKIINLGNAKLSRIWKNKYKCVEVQLTKNPQKLLLVVNFSIYHNSYQQIQLWNLNTQKIIRTIKTGSYKYPIKKMLGYKIFWYNNQIIKSEKQNILGMINLLTFEVTTKTYNTNIDEVFEVLDNGIIIYQAEKRLFPINNFIVKF